MSTSFIPRRELFGNPNRSGGGISPDGKWLSWVAPLEGVMNLWIAPRERPEDAKPITEDRDRGVQSYGWTFDSRFLLYPKDSGGDENWHVYAVELATGESRNLTPYEGAQCNIAGVSKQSPGDVLITSNKRDPRYADLMRVDIASGRVTPVAENLGFAGFICDDHFRPQLALAPREDGSLEILRRDGSEWRSWMTFPVDDARTSGPSHLDADGTTLFYFDSRGRDTSALMAIDIVSEETRLIAADPRADIGGAITDNDSHHPLAYSVVVARHEYHVLDERIRADVEFLNEADIGDWYITSRTLDDTLWTIGTDSDVMPGRAWLYDRTARTVTPLYETRPELAKRQLAPMYDVSVPSRDGLSLTCYLTLPRDADLGGDRPRARAPQPLVLSVHGGPWMRDTFGFNTEHQWLADRGYAVMNVNFRGSSGFGKSFLAAGDAEWGARMDDDLSDAVDWAIAQGLADPDRIAIMGGSYGGYATLAALTRHPTKYACGIDIVGPSNLETLLESIPAYWESEREKLYRAIGNPNTDEGRAMLRERSPLHRAADIQRPLLIGQGANDPRVKQAESDQMVAAMERSGVPVTYIVYPDEGHGFHRPPNRVSFNAFVEAFLAHHLGGGLEPIHAEEVAGATFQLAGDAEWLRNLLPNSQRVAPITI